MRYGSGYGSLRSLAVLALRPTEPTPLVSSSLVGTSAWVGALANIVHQEGVVFAIKWSPWA
jgi:hypothetical protein